MKPVHKIKCGDILEVSYMLDFGPNLKQVLPVQWHCSVSAVLF